MKIIHGQPSWTFSSDTVTAAVTRLGGHLAPVRFRLGDKTVQPFAIAPWHSEKLARDTAPVLVPLRGDFFCAPFGGNSRPWRGERHPAHGESATNPWTFVALESTASSKTLLLSLETKIRPGSIRKMVTLRKGEATVYVTHELSGFSGPMNLGHHATLQFPLQPASGIISTSQIHYGQVAPLPLEDPALGGYHCLRPGSRFQSLECVERLDGTNADLTSYPARDGFEDLVLVVHKDSPDFAWTAVSFPNEGYVWFALKNPALLQSTVLWISNGGRHYPPWNGRHRGVMGLEDVTSFFHYGLAESVAPNDVSKAGYPTVLQLRKNHPLRIPYILGVAPIPKTFGKVGSIVRIAGGIRIVPVKGRSIEIPADTAFLHG